MIDTVFLLHPKTQEVFNIKDAAAYIGITTGALYGRLRLGDMGLRLWRPKGAKVTENKPEDFSALALAKCTDDERYIG